MSSHPIVLWPDPVLVTPAAPVTTFGAELAELLQHLRDSLGNGFTSGLGLAAPQIGVAQRVAIALRRGGKTPEVVELINPSVVGLGTPDSVREGCLSLPHEFVRVKRYARVVVSYQDRHGAQRRETAAGLYAQTLQHEVDHLNGRLILDRIGSMRRQEVETRLGNGAATP